MPVEFDAEIAINEVTLQADADISTPGTGDTSYLSLTEKPQINGVTLVGNLLTEDLNIDHVLVADNLSSHDGTTNTSPYTLRTAPAYAGSVAELRKVVGGTVGWNQHIADSGSTTTNNGITFTKNGDGSWTLTGTASSNNCFCNINYANGVNSMGIVPNHVYFVAKGTTANNIGFRLYGVGSSYYSATYRDRIIKDETVAATTYIRLQVNDLDTVNIGTVKVWPCCIDLTDLLGPTIADYIYSLETATEGAGVAWFRQCFSADYYAYSATTLQSVNTSARKVLDSNGNTVRTYPLDSDLTLRGIPRLSNGNLYYDGDEYLPNGTVNRRYWEFDLGAVTFTLSSTAHVFTYNLNSTNTNGHARAYSSSKIVRVNGYVFWGNGTSTNVLAGLSDMEVGCYSTTANIAIRNDSCDTAAELKTALNGVHIVYELATPTTETADPYTSTQLVDNQGSEQFVTTTNTPVGNETFYPEDLTGVVQDLAPLPTSAGTYKLQVTVSGGVRSYSWVSG